MPARSKKHVASSVSRSDRAALQPESSLARIPSPVRFLLVVVSSLVLSSVLFTFSADVTLGDLGAVSKHLEEWWEVGGLVGWKAVELGLAWMLGFDGRDVASSIFLTHLPTFTLLASFYGVRPTTMLASFGITLFSTAAPFALLRRPSSVHDLSHAPSGTVSNRSIIQDRATALYTTMAASSIFAVVVYLSYATWLPAQLVLHFENIPDITAAHAGPAGLPVLFLSLVPAGWAARDFLFVSSAGSTADHDEKEEGEEGQDGEYLVEAVCRQTWGRLSAKTRVLVARTFYLAVMLVLNTVVQVAGTIRGVDLQGASAWGTVWAVAALAIGFTFGWIEAVDGV